MTVRLTRVYTKTGDAGQTHLGDMSRVAKTDPRLVAYADVDEANSVLGVALALGSPSPELTELLRSVQNDLFDVGADLSTPVTPDPQYPPLRVTAAYTERLEAACDTYNAELPKLASFILPGGTPLAALLHQARVVTRRAERSVWALLEAAGERTNAETARYLNRLSDLLFILARVANPGGDVLWEPGAHSGAHAQRGGWSAQAGGADSTQERKPVTVEPSIASSRGPSGVAMVRTTTSAGSARSSRPGLPRHSPWSSARQSRSCGRTESDSPRYQSSMSPPYQATPTAHRGDRTGRSHMVTAPRPESRNRRRSRNATAITTSATPGRTSRTVVTGVPMPAAGSVVAQTSSPAALSRDCARRAASSASGSSEPSARLSASRARATSISVETSAVSARMDTPRSVIDRNPPCAATMTSSPDSVRMVTTPPSASWPSRGA